MPAPVEAGMRGGCQPSSVRSGARGEGAVAGGPAPGWPLRTARMTLRPYRVVAPTDARNPTPARMAGTLRTALRLVSPVVHPRSTPPARTRGELVQTGEHLGGQPHPVPTPSGHGL